MLKNKHLLGLGGLSLGLALWLSNTHSTYANSGYGGGSGTESNPYLISTPNHLIQLHLDMTSHGFDTTGIYFKLTDNIDLSGYDSDSDGSNGNWTPLGTEEDPFKGVFDGNGYKISNVNINLPSEVTYVGFFGKASSATIKNLGLENTSIVGRRVIGGLVAHQEGGVILNCYVNLGSVSNSNPMLTLDYVGGLAGSLDNVNISQSHSNVTVKASSYGGGLVGRQGGGSIVESYASGNVSGGERTGGLVAILSNSEINKSYASGNATVEFNEPVLDYMAAGGLVGDVENSNISQSHARGNAKTISDMPIPITGYAGGLVGALQSGRVEQSYSTGVAKGLTETGGLIGIKLSGTVHNCYWNTETSGLSNSQGGTGLTSNQMTGENAKNHMLGFDFSDGWSTTDGYPSPTIKGDTPPIIPPTQTDKSDLTVNGKIETMVADITIPSISPDLIINPNLPEGFVAPEFSIENRSVSPIKLELRTFEQVTDTFNDVLPSKYSSWEGLNKRESQDIALGLVVKEGEGWQTRTTQTSYVAGHQSQEIGIIKPTSTVDFSFDVKHGTAFSEAKIVQYKMVFVFDLLS